MPRSKKELDKEVMYSKIMPTLSHSGEKGDEPSPPSVPVHPGVPAIVPAAAPSNDAISRLRSKLFDRVPSSSQAGVSGQNAVLLNLMEYQVAERLDEAFSKFNCCKCDHCRKDVAALALNRLPSRYAVAPPEDLPAMDAEISGKEVSAALVQAILQVRSHPRH